MVQDSVLSLRELKTHFFTRRGVAKAVDGVSLDLRPGETLGVVGESGSGKIVTSLSILRLVPPPGRIVSGEILFEGRNLAALSEAEPCDLSTGCPLSRSVPADAMGYVRLRQEGQPDARLAAADQR